MKKNIGNAATALAIAMAIGGLGIGAGITGIKVMAETETGTSSDAATEESTEETEEFEVNTRLPGGFSVIGLDNVGTYDALSNALAGVQGKLDEKKIILDVDGQQFEVTYAELGAAIENKEFILSEARKYSSGNMIQRFVKSSELESNPENITPNIIFNEESLNAFFDRINSENPGSPVNASIKRVNGAFEITNEKDGLAIDKEGTVELMKQAALKDGEDTIKVAVTKQSPTIKADDLREIKDVLGSFTTNYSSSSADRATNIAVGSAKIDGTLLMPGQTLSGYEKMHPFTVGNGYKIAKAYENGLVVDSVGGGACQIATTLYQAALRAEVEITERKNHSMIVNYVQPSGDAAIAGDYKDIKITNNRSTPIYVEAVTVGRDVTFTIWGKEDRPANRTVEFVSEVLSETPKGNTYKDDPSRPSGYLHLESAGHKGRVSKLWKVVKENGVEVSRELVSSDTYRMSNDIYIRGVMAPAPAPAPAPSEESTEAPSDGGSENVTPAPDPAPAPAPSPDQVGPAYDPNLNPGP